MGKRPPDQPIRVLLVEDSRSQRELLMSILISNGFVIAGAVENGRDAITAAQRLRPDVVAMDIHLQPVDGYEATRQIMQLCPTPIVLISASTGDAAARSLAALSAGALTVVQKPGGPAHPTYERDCAALVTTLRLMADVLVVTRFPQRRPTTEPLSTAVGSGMRQNGSNAPCVLALAASTGGPTAVQTLLRGLKPVLPLPVLLVQHIARGFVKPLVDWLRSTLPLQIRIAEAGERLEPATVYLAPDDYHLLAGPNMRAELRPQAPDDRYCPSADLLFESIRNVRIISLSVRESSA